MKPVKKRTPPHHQKKPRKTIPKELRKKDLQVLIEAADNKLRKLARERWALVVKIDEIYTQLENLNQRKEYVNKKKGIYLNTLSKM